MSEHTPTPWAYHSWDSASGKSFGIETADHRHGIAGITPNGNASTLLTMEQHESNAEHICRCVNLHDELVKALEAFVAPWDIGGEWRSKLTYATFDNARSILAKAKGVVTSPKN